jgi:hypothetical protein
MPLPKSRTTGIASRQSSASATKANEPKANEPKANALKANKPKANGPACTGARGAGFNQSVFTCCSAHIASGASAAPIASVIA